MRSDIRSPYLCSICSRASAPYHVRLVRPDVRRPVKSQFTCKSVRHSVSSSVVTGPHLRSRVVVRPRSSWVYTSLCLFSSRRLSHAFGTLAPAQGGGFHVARPISSRATIFSAKESTHTADWEGDNMNLRHPTIDGVLAPLRPHFRRFHRTAATRPLLDPEVRHHPHVLVLQLVAMEEVHAAGIGVETDQDLDGLPVLEEHGVLPAPLPREDGTAAAAP